MPLHRYRLRRRGRARSSTRSSGSSRTTATTRTARSPARSRQLEAAGQVDSLFLGLMEPRLKAGSRSPTSGCADRGPALPDARQRRPGVAADRCSTPPPGGSTPRAGRDGRRPPRDDQLGILEHHAVAQSPRADRRAARAPCELAGGLQDPEQAILNVHVPPFGTQLDDAPVLDADLRVVQVAGSGQVRPGRQHRGPRLRARDASRCSACTATSTSRPGSGASAARSPSTPGSDYSTGALHGALVTLKDGKVAAHQLVRRLSPWTGDAGGDRRRHVRSRARLRSPIEGERLLEVRRSYPTTSPRRLGGAGPPALAFRSDRRPWPASSCSWDRGRRVVAIGLTGQCPSVCLVDARGEPIGPGLIYRDNRATARGAAIRERMGDATVHAPDRPSAGGVPRRPKLMWLKDHEPRPSRVPTWRSAPRPRRARADRRVATDGTHAAATLAFDLRRRAWADDLVRYHGPATRPLPTAPPVVGADGRLMASVARRVGLPAGTPIIMGGADSQACALGAGVVGRRAGERDGRVVDLPERRRAAAAVGAGGHPLPARGPRALTTETGINTTGAALAWMRRPVLRATRATRRRRGLRPARPRGGRRAAGADGVLALPVLARRRTDRSGPGAAFPPVPAPRPRRPGARHDGGRGLRDP